MTQQSILRNCSQLDRDDPVVVVVRIDGLELRSDPVRIEEVVHGTQDGLEVVLKGRVGRVAKEVPPIDDEWNSDCHPGDDPEAPRGQRDNGGKRVPVFLRQRGEKTVPDISQTHHALTLWASGLCETRRSAPCRRHGSGSNDE